MKILTFSTLFPHAARPGHGIFVETRLRQLVASGEVHSRVVAPIPWFPSTHERFGSYAVAARAPRHETRFGLQVDHPRYPAIPKVGMTIAPFLLARTVKPVLRKLIRDGFDFDLIDAHYFYPDGVAAAMLGNMLNKPVVITARGSDISLIPRYYLPRKMILWAANAAKGVVTVCDALKQELVQLGVPAQRITTLRNGVDLALFRPLQDRAVARKALGLDRFTLLAVGHLTPVKGHELMIDALPLMPDVHLMIAGGGPLRAALEAQAQRLNVAQRVTFLGPVPQARLPDYYGAADALVLASSREGWANVLLESMACGTPVVASNVWGTPEVVAEADAGILMRERTPQGLAHAVGSLRAHYPDRTATRRYAERFSWDDTTAGQLRLFSRILGLHTEQTCIS